MISLYSTPFIDDFTFQNLKNTRHSVVSFHDTANDQTRLQTFAYSGKEIFEDTSVYTSKKQLAAHIYRERDSSGILHGKSYIVLPKKNPSGHKQVIAETYNDGKLIKQKETDKPKAIAAIKDEIANGREFKENRLDAIAFLLSNGPWQRYDDCNSLSVVPRIGLDISDKPAGHIDGLYNMAFKLRTNSSVSADGSMFYTTGANHVGMIEDIIMDAQVLSEHKWKRQDSEDGKNKTARITTALPDDESEKELLVQAMERIGLLDITTHYSKHFENRAISTAGGASVLFMQQLMTMTPNVKILKAVTNPRIINLHTL